jgi:hypothetical protein
MNATRKEKTKERKRKEGKKEERRGLLCDDCLI